MEDHAHEQTAAGAVVDPGLYDDVFGASATDSCTSWSSSACESNVWRRSWSEAARLGTRGGSVEAKGYMASMAGR
jgi:hypothetical protein